MSLAELVSPFSSRIEREYSRERIESFWALESLLRELIDGGHIRKLLNHELEQLRLDPTYSGDWRENQLILHRGRGVALSVTLLVSRQEYIHSVPFCGMYVPLGPQPLRCNRFELPPQYENQVFDPRLKLLPVGSTEIAPGEVLRVSPDHLIHDFLIDEPVAVLKLTTTPYQTLEWLFRRDSLEAWQANDSALWYSQLRVAAYVLGRLAHQSSLEPLKELTAYDHHSVRWAAIQALGRLSRSVAIEKLTAALTDPHPHVRRAASKALQQLKPS